MIRKQHLVAAVAILAAFALGLVAFFMVSDGKPDGLEFIMEENGITEPEPIYTAPLDYGSDYLSSLTMGILGFIIVLGVMLAYLIVIRKRNAKGMN